uniref:Uncharacterized protein n=1 Tax=Parascaris univalens TaxID=6257 RepID=A0A915CAK5_PARUN
METPSYRYPENAKEMRDFIFHCSLLQCSLRSFTTTSI